MAPSEKHKRVFYNTQGLPPHWGSRGWGVGGVTCTEKAAELYWQCCACGISLVNILCFVLFQREQQVGSVCLSPRAVSVMGRSASVFDGWGFFQLPHCNINLLLVLSTGAH